MDILIRGERKEDYDDIKKINDLAFGQENEGRMVEALRKTRGYNPKLSLVAELNNNIVGHILFYPIKIKNEKKEFTALSLAPMAVCPKYQNKGIGNKLVIKGIEVAREYGFGAVIVVGHPKYYPRFGFQPASNWRMQLPFDVPDDVFLALELRNNYLKSFRGKVEYPREYFDAL
ncbi:MAG: N-acetyltransferase [Candidatus Thermoplasmatota archaeon]|nr:N-acetyltransferase [Candidatus Thermoplasmatota archaeon]